MFDQVKQDPSKPGEKDDEDEIIVSDYLKYEKGEILRTEGYYITKVAPVKGHIKLCKDYLQFEPINCAENECVMETLNTFNAMIDYNDIVETEIIKLINEKALMQANDFIKEAYMYDYLI